MKNWQQIEQLLLLRRPKPDKNTRYKNQEKTLDHLKNIRPALSFSSLLKTKYLKYTWGYRNRKK